MRCLSCIFRNRCQTVCLAHKQTPLDCRCLETRCDRLSIVEVAKLVKKAWEAGRQRFRRVLLAAIWPTNFPNLTSSGRCLLHFFTTPRLVFPPSNYRFEGPGCHFESTSASLSRGLAHYSLMDIAAEISSVYVGRHPRQSPRARCQLLVMSTSSNGLHGSLEGLWSLECTPWASLRLLSPGQLFILYMAPQGWQHGRTGRGAW